MRKERDESGGDVYLGCPEVQDGLVDQGVQFLEPREDPEVLSLVLPCDLPMYMIKHNIFSKFSTQDDVVLNI